MRRSTLLRDVDGVGGLHDRRYGPSCLLVDGQNLGMGYGNGINAADPKPVETIEVRLADPLAVKRLTISGGTLQVLGPWNVGFPR